MKIFLPIFLFFIFAIFSTASAFSLMAEEQSKAMELANTEQWRLLLHFRHDWKMGDKSEIDAGDFFLSPDGKRDPLKEMEATLAAVSSDRQIGTLKQHPLCAFQGRYEFLERKVGIRFPKKECPKYDQFIESFNDPKSISIIFSSAYANNPASMFGHLFLKVQSSKPGDLLDNGINYAAQVPGDENPFAFFYFGVFGGYYGHWSIQPFYEKLNEYIKAENRDLWEYEINLSKEEVKFLLKHLWEVETTGLFDYYFFDENCAYQIMRLFEVVKPEWNLSDHTIYAIPGEMTKNLFNRPDIVREVRLRPSLRRRLLQKYKKLAPEKKEVALSVIKSDGKPIQVGDAETLDLLNTYFDFRRQIKEGKISKGEQASWNSVMSQRAALGKGEPQEVLKAETRPDLGHDAYSIALLAGTETNSQKQNYGYLGFRWESAYHDLFNKDLGYKKFSEIQFPWVEIRSRSNEKIQLEEVGAVKIVSLIPYSRLDFNPSWKISISVESPKDDGCLDCRRFMWQGGLGISSDFISEENIIYSLVTLQVEAEEKLPLGHKLMPGLEIGLLFTPSDNWKIGMLTSYAKDVGADRNFDNVYRYGLKQSFSLRRNWELRQSFQWNATNLSVRPNYTEARLDLSYYFR